MPMPFGERLKLIRTKLGKTQKEMANECGIGITTLQRYEKGAEFPAGTLFLKIAELGYSLDWLLVGGSVEMIADSMPKPRQEEEGGIKHVTKKISIKGIIEEWIQDVREKESNTDRIVMELAMQVPEFRQWYQEKKNKTTLAEDDLTREKIA